MTELRPLQRSIKELIDAFPNKGVTPSTMATYMKYLSNLPEEWICEAIDRLIQTSTFLPAIAEIRNVVIETYSGLPNEEEAEMGVRHQLATRTTGDGLGPWDVHPLVLEVVRTIGTHEIRHDEKGFAMHRFRELYRERRSKYIADLQSGAVALPSAVGGEIVQLPRRAS